MSRGTCAWDESGMPGTASAVPFGPIVTRIGRIGKVGAATKRARAARCCMRGLQPVVHSDRGL